MNPPQNSGSKPGQTINYSASIVPKQPSGKGNKKQQQQQQQQQKNLAASGGTGNGNNGAASFVIIQPRKNSKNQKMPNGKGGKLKQTTPHPFTTLYFNKDRKYDFVNGVMSVNRPTTTIRPANKPPANSNMNVASGSGMGNSNGNNYNGNGNGRPNDKTIGHEKVAIKAPKQIKEKTATATTAAAAGPAGSKATTIGLLAAQIEMLDTMHQPHTSNSNIPKLFQKYEKIQQIYPEFHPYVVQQPKQSSSNGGKPSRDGSRNQFFSTHTDGDGGGTGTGTGNGAQKSGYSLSSAMSSSSLSSSSLSSASLSSASTFGSAAKKSSAVAVSAAAANGSGGQRTQNSAFVSSSTKIGKG